MDSKQRYGCAVFLENDVVAGIERGDAAVRSVSLLILLKVISHASTTPDVIPVEAGLHNEDSIRLSQHRIFKLDACQFAEALMQSLLGIFRYPICGHDI